MLLGIYGAGGLGREILILARQINENGKRWDDCLFIDDTKKQSVLFGQQVLSFDEVKDKYTGESLEVIIAVGEPHARKILRERVTEADFSLTVLIHPSVMIDNSTKLGWGTVVGLNCFISCDISIGENVLIQPNACIGHDNQIGNDSVISTFVCIAGGCIIGDETYIGLNVPIKENIKIGNQSIVGMGSVVSRDIPDQVIALGNPARVMKDNIEHKVFH